MAANVRIDVHSVDVGGAAGDDLALRVAYDLWSASYWSSGLSFEEPFTVTLVGNEVVAIQSN